MCSEVIVKKADPCDAACNNTALPEQYHLYLYYIMATFICKIFFQCFIYQN